MRQKEEYRLIRKPEGIISDLDVERLMWTALPVGKVSKKKKRVTETKVGPVSFNHHPVQEEKSGQEPQSKCSVWGRKYNNGRNGVTGGVRMQQGWK